VEFLQADVRDPQSILEQAAQSLDLSQPVGVLLLGVLHFLPDYDEVASIMAAFRAGTAPGTHFVVSHLASDIEPRLMASFTQQMGKAGVRPGALRSRDKVTEIFAGQDLLDPGVVPVSRWRPDTELEATAVTTLWGGVARKN